MHYILEEVINITLIALFVFSLEQSIIMITIGYDLKKKFIQIKRMVGCCIIHSAVL